MIERLQISNYALIDSLEAEFTQGLNIITGETGAGKSIILGALSLLLGSRADMKAVRDPQKKLVIEAVFNVSGYDMLRKSFQQADIDWDESTCILRREITPSGRSRAFINDTPVTLQTLHDAGLQLVDIHSQHQNLLLSNHDYQLSVIDSLADNAALLQEYAEAYTAYRAALREYTEMRDMITRNKADADFISFQLDQLNEMRLLPGEQEQLEQERDVLQNMSSIKEHLTDALENLSGRDANALSLVNRSLESLRKLSDVLPDADSLAERLDSARLEIEDIAESLSDIDGSLGGDPAQLDVIEERLSKIYSLEAKHHVDNSDALIALRDKLAAQLNAIENADDALGALENRAKAAKKQAMIIARQISERRQACAASFAEELRQRAMPLGMKNLRCEIAIATGKLSPSGIDAVDFKFAFNKNQQLMSVGSTASGGEISRLILAIKITIAEKMRMPTLIFDEVDTGVSGDVAVRMAALMAQVSHSSQVLAITHLPQVAAMGASHYKVYKEDDEDKTNTRIRLLSEDERLQEIAMMLSGRSDDPSALAAAASMLSGKNKDK